MRIVVTGGYGQVGQALAIALRQHTVVATRHDELNISDPLAIAQLVALQPDLIIHSAAWTNVDACAREPDRALITNGLGTKHVALACLQLDAPLVYISTNEVFDGNATQPYLEFDRANPANAYGYSKWVGEQVIQQLLTKFYIVRVAWVFGGARNFVQTILRLAQERSELAVVDDEIGNPTYAPDLAEAVRQLIQQPAYGVYHLTNEGYCSRWEFAREIVQQAGFTHVAIKPIKLADYKRDSTPPPFSALRNFVAAYDLGLRLRPWQAALADALKP